MTRFVIQHILVCLIFCFSVLSTSLFAQPHRPTEKDVQIQKVFIEASKEKLLGNYEDAIFLFNEVLHKDKRNHAAMFELAQLYLLTDRDDKAFAKIEEALENDESNLWYNLFYTDLLEKKGDFAKGAEVFEKLVDLYPEKEEYLFDLAYFLAKSARYQDAIDVFDKLEIRIGMSEELTMQKHSIYMAMNAAEKATAELEKLIARYPDDVRYLHVMASHLKGMGDHEGAEAIFEEIIKIDPNDPSAKMALAESYKANGDHVKYLSSITDVFGNPDVNIDAKVQEIIPYIDMVARGIDEELTEKALELARLIAEAHPTEAKAYSLNGDMLYNAGYLEKSLVEYRKAIELEKNVFTLWQQIFLINSELGNFEDLVDDTETALDYFPNQPLAYFFSGVAHARVENHETAIEMLEEALMLSSKNQQLKAEIYVQLGSAYNETKEFEKSDNAFEEALSINANNALALNNYSYYLSVRNEMLDRAENMAWRANELVPNQPSYMDTLGWVFYKKKRFKEAKDWIKKAIENGGDTSPQILENYGDVLYQLKEVDEAVEYWMKAQENGSSSEVLEKKIADRKLYE
ncbi:MAG: tetratricopeptide repeat protein [Bacteroidota bacterium]